MKSRFIAILPLFALCAALLAIAAQKAPKPKLSMDQARAIALKIAPGKIKDAEYEFEDGLWRYSFDIVQGKRIHEIGVDAMTGKVVEDAFEAAGTKD
ncbi:MAG: PepSY domain-containing protein [Sphingobium sp.]|nr:PepSY domain-containing protein [Sphingobium sp.]